MGSAIKLDPVSDRSLFTYTFTGTIVLRFACFSPDWSETQEAIKMLDDRYKDKWNSMTELDSTRSYYPKSLSISKDYCPNFGDHFEEVVYPEGDPDAVSISKRDVDLLQPETFINDTIIDFYIMYLKNRMIPEEKHRFHFFNSFFFIKLADLDKDPSIACEGRATFQRVRRWTAKVKLFDKDYIFIPVNFSLHWSLLVICHPGEIANFREEQMDKSSRAPCILHMDSIRGSHKGLKNLIQRYLFEEWKERHNEVAEDVSRKFLNLQFVSLKLPQQENSFDCGLFLLHYVELFLEQAPVNFNLFQITAPSKFLAEDWFPSEDVACKREHIKRLICEISKTRGQKVSPVDFDDNCSLHRIEEGHTCTNFLQESCSARETCGGYDLCSIADELQIVSPVANLIRSLKSAAVSDEALRDLSLPGDATEDKYHHYGQKASVNRFSNVMSPIEEEDQIRELMSISPAIKAGSQQIECFAAVSHAPSSLRSETPLLGRISRSLWNDRIHQNNCCGSPNSVEIQNEEDLSAEVEEVSSPDTANNDSPISTEELACYIVLDSQEENENHDWNGLENNLAATSALCHKDVDFTDNYNHRVNEKILPQSVEQAARKLRHVPEILEVSSSGIGKDQIASSSTSSEELATCYVQDTEEVNSCIQAKNLKLLSGSGNKHVAEKTRHLFRHRRRVIIDLSKDIYEQRC